MEMATKNIGIGEKITDVRDLLRLAIAKKSVIWRVKYKDRVIPAAIVINWPLALLLNTTLHYSIKL